MGGPVVEEQQGFAASEGGLVAPGPCEFGWGKMIFIFVSGFLRVFLMWLIPVQTVAAVTALMAVNACLAAGFRGFTWYRHFIFLSYLGGLLVLFLYSTALAPCPVKLTRVRPGFTWIHVKLYFVFVAVY